MSTNFILDFLADLTENNQKTWFDSQRKRYEQAKKAFGGYVGEVLTGLQAFDETLLRLEAKNCIFRINRDVRFSSDKSPYKNNFGAFFQEGGKKSMGAGYYLHLQAGGCFVAGGIYAPCSPEVGKIRQEIDYNLEEFQGIITEASFAQYFGGLSGEPMKGTPRGYKADNPALPYLRYKSYTVYRPLADELMRGENWVGEILATFQAMKPLLDFLNRAIE